MAQFVNVFIKIQKKTKRYKRKENRLERNNKIMKFRYEKIHFQKHFKQ